MRSSPAAFFTHRHESRFMKKTRGYVFFARLAREKMVEYRDIK